MTDTVIFVLTILLQAIATVSTLMLIPLSRQALAWVFLSAAFLLMTVHYVLAFFAYKDLIATPWLSSAQPGWITLLVSTLLLVGVYFIRQVLLQRNRIEEALRVSDERYELACRGANDGIWDWDLQTDRIYFSPRWKAILGFEGHERQISDRPTAWFDRVHSQDRQELESTLQSHFDQKLPFFRNEHRILHRDGDYRWVVSRGMAVWDQSERPIRIVGSHTDITERKKIQQKILYDANHDELTGLPNRAYFTEKLNSEAKKAKLNSSYLFVVLFLNLDRFKVINDSLGHSIGDELIATVAGRLSTWAPDDAVIARMGGDEFAILLREVKNVKEAAELASLLQKVISRPMDIRGHEVYTTVSIGIADSNYGADEPEHILRAADTALHQAKDKGKTRYEIFDNDMHKTAIARLKLESDLRRAMGRDEFVLHYQPIVSITNKRLIGFEALVRWNHPRLGLIHPDQFIPLAEETGLIVPMGEWILHEGCAQIQQWHQTIPATKNLSMNINISSMQFAQHDLTAKIEEILHITGLPGHYLRLEITESTLIQNVESAMTMFDDLRKLGIRIYMDDFGTGYSSLSYLVRFPLDGIKIDRSFISSLDGNGEQPKIVKAIIELANSLGIDVIAEGVEVAEQTIRLKLFKCKYAQGNHFSMPLPSQQAALLIRSAARKQ